MEIIYTQTWEIIIYIGSIYIKPYMVTVIQQGRSGASDTVKLASSMFNKENINSKGYRKQAGLTY